VIYLASCYSHPDPEVRKDRYHDAMYCTSALITHHGLVVYSPIVHCHPMSIRHGMPTDAVFWRRYNYAMLRKADALYVLKLEGWDESAGVKEELTLAEQMMLTIHYVDENGVVVL